MESIKRELKTLEEQGLYRFLRTLEEEQGPEIVLNGKKLLNFCSNNYLDLARDPRLKAAAIEAAEGFGTSSGASRLISGNFTLHETLEEELAQFKGTESALLFNSGYQANIGVIPTLAREGDVIFSDELNHASLIDGCRLSEAKTAIYHHNDMDALEAQLKRRSLMRSPQSRFLIVSESVFSMEGDLCKLTGLLALAAQYEAFVYLDEAHAVGIFGKRGTGLIEHTFDQEFDVRAHERLLQMGTLGKAFGSYGAFVACSKTLRNYLLNKSRSFIFSTSLPPPVVAASLEALRIIQSEPERREQLWKNILYLKRKWPDTASDSPIFPWVIGSAERTMATCESLMKQGYFLQGIRPPTVPPGTSRLRLTLMSSHTEEQIDRLMGVLNLLLQQEKSWVVS